MVFFVGCFLLGSVTVFFKKREIPRYPLKRTLLSETTREDGRININKAGFDELVRLKGIGRMTAIRIMDYRKNSGPFFYKEDLMKIKGIGRGKFDRIKDRVVIK